MSQQISAGVMLYRRDAGEVEILIAHPGGPFWARKDEGAWSIPKGLIDDDEDARTAAKRELAEETGCEVDDEALWALGEVRLKSGKRVVAFAAEAPCDPDLLDANEFEMEWPPRSGRTASFPEIDRIEWVTPEVAARKLNPAQASLVENLLRALGSG